MVPSAPHLDPRVLATIRRRALAPGGFAEIWRAAGERATALGVPRPSYSQVRRLVRAERARRDHALEVLEHAAARTLAGRPVDGSAILDELGDALSRPAS